MRLFALLVAFLPLAGCNNQSTDSASSTEPGGGTALTPVDDEDGTDETGDSDGTADTPPAIADIKVDDAGLAPDGNVLVTFTQPVTEELLVDAVIFRNASGTAFIPVDTIISDDGLSVEVVPRAELEQDDEYILELDASLFGKVAVDSVARASKGSEWQEVVGVLVRMRSHRPLVVKSFDEDGVLWMYSGTLYEDGGNAWTRFTSNAPGPNGIWGDTDDNVISLSRGWRLEDGTVERIQYSGPGVDGNWFELADNEFSVRSRAKRIPFPDKTRLDNNSRLQSRAAGPDGEWFTMDDDYRHVALATFDAETGIAISIHGNGVEPGEVGPGADQEWLTRDDKFERYRVREFDPSLRLLRRIEYSAPGPDTLWFTPDDVVTNYSRITYDNLGWRSEVTYFTEPGDDGLWFTADDRGSGRYRYEYLSDELDLFESWFESGPDELSGTQDDVFRDYSYVRSTRGGKAVAFGRFDGAGGDGEWFTDDDTLGSASWVVGTVDSHGRITTARHYESLGTDGRRFTDDDGPVEHLYTWTYADDGIQRTLRAYRSPGGNGTWGDEDDIPSLHYEYLEE